MNYGVIDLACNFVCSALQFQLGGIVKPNDGECHLDTRGEYTHSKLQDYPSISQVNLKVRQNTINVIFAVTAEQIHVYDRLKDNVEGASSGMLSHDSSNVVELVREQYSVSAVVWCHLIHYLFRYIITSVSFYCWFS